MRPIPHLNTFLTFLAGFSSAFLFLIPKLPITGQQYSTNLYTPFLATNLASDDAATAYTRAKLESQHLDTNSFTIIVLTFERVHLLRKNLDNWTNGSLPSLSHIIVNWPPQSQEIPTDLLSRTWALPVTFRRVSGVYGNRFERPKEIRTQAVMTLDDDVFMDPNEIEFGFQVFRRMDQPFVGWIPRHYYLENGERLYTWNVDVEYSMILTGASFMHIALYDAYSIERFAGLRQGIAERKNCDDILMNFVLRNATGKSALLIDGQNGNIKHCGSGGISSQNNHLNLRHGCLKEFFKFFGDDALETSELIVTPQYTSTGFENVSNQKQPCKV